VITTKDKQKRENSKAKAKINKVKHELTEESSGQSTLSKN
jgi:hypothetical protein